MFWIVGSTLRNEVAHLFRLEEYYGTGVIDLSPATLGKNSFLVLV